MKLLFKRKYLGSIEFKVTFFHTFRYESVSSECKRTVSINSQVFNITCLKVMVNIHVCFLLMLDII